MSSSEELINRRERVVCRGVGRLSDMTAASANGATLVDVEGRAFIDFAGGIGVMNLGHCDPEVVEAIREQAGRLIHASIHVATYEPYVALCEKLVEILPHGPNTKALLVNSGAEAVENAIKIARQATGRDAIICYTGGFHGRTLLATTLTSKISYKVGCGPFAPEVYRLPYPVVRLRTGETEQQVVDRELARLRGAILDTVSATDVAAVIIELVQGEGGFNVVPAAYMHGLRQICDEHGIVLIADEVQTGFARTGSWGAYQQLGFTPDLSTWAKSLGSGLPISSVIGKASVMDKVTPGTLGGTYGGNPVACVAALATIKRMEELKLNERAVHIGKIIRDRLDAIASKVIEVTDVRGLGAMMALEFNEGGNPAHPAKQLVAQIIEECQRNGLLIIPAGVNGNVIRLLAPIVISDDALIRGLDILEHAILSSSSNHAQSLS